MPNILVRKQKAFVLWRPGNTDDPPMLVIGQLQLGNPVEIVNKQYFTMQQVVGFPDLWELPADQCSLTDGSVYHYWFEVSACDPKLSSTRILITDPTATMVDWRVCGPRLASPCGDEHRYPPAVVKFLKGELVPSDPGGETAVIDGECPLNELPPNNRLVIYELPTTWMRSAEVGGRDMGVGTFRDVTALIDANVEGANFDDLDVTKVGRSYLSEIGINALELLPPADSVYNRQWGYGTTNFLAPDFELGFPGSFATPVPNKLLGELVGTCHKNHIRFFVDSVMAFSKNNSYLAACCGEFFIHEPDKAESDPDAHSSRGKVRDGFGASLFRYAKPTQGYDPFPDQPPHVNPGHPVTIYPARQLMKTALARWMKDFHIDGLRLDSIENVANWDFVEQYKNLARDLNQERFKAANLSGADERFLVVGEELEEPLALLHQQRLDGLWHQKFMHYIKMAIIGRNHEEETNFERTVRRAIDCRLFGYPDLAKAVIYLASHDVEGYRNERLYNFLLNTGNAYNGQQRVKLAFVCLLTAVGIPMILAGDEFADQHDRFDAKGNVTHDGGKQIDPVNFGRLGDTWRREIKEYVARLVKLRTTCDALSVCDTDFIHVDFNENKRVMVWKRGVAGATSQVVVVANFSDYCTPDAMNPGSEYYVPNWPATPQGMQWREVTRDRIVLGNKVAREPIFPWEAKVYALSDTATDKIP